jgi:translation initiation factor RLI1
MGKYLVAVDMDKCRAPDECALVCMNTCPTKVLAHRPLDPTAPSDGVVIQATHPLLCDGCMLCVKSCEPGAISIESPTGA